MVVFNPQKKEIDIKVVYYGPALCGKTTNLKSVHLNLNPQQRGELISLATKDDRTLFFDFLPIQLENIRGFKTRFHIYTVPGQVFYTLTRKAVLTGVDGVIFVADSQNGKMKENIESLNDLKDNLKYYNKTLESIPLIFQYNKRDLPDLIPITVMNEQLNSMRAPFFEACALSGKGVMETLTMCCKLVLNQMQNKSKAERPVGRVSANAAPNGGQTAVELPKLTLAEDAAPAGDAVADHPPSQTGEQTGADAVGVTGRVAQSAVHAGHTVPDPLNGQSAAEASGGSRQKDAAGEEEQEHHVPPPGEISRPHEVKNEDEKRICPRCSLKFKPNVKQCPICRVNLVSEDQMIVIKTAAATGPALLKPVAAAYRQSACDDLPANNTPDDGNGEQQLEIVSCDQPLKASDHSVTIPMVMKLKGNHAPLKVELTISINNIPHNHHI